MKNTFSVVCLLAMLFSILFFSGCTKNLSQADRDSVDTILLSSDNITPTHQDVTAYNFVLGAKRYNDIIPAIEMNQSYGKILINALKFQLDQNTLFDVVKKEAEADATFYCEYSVMLQQMENFTDYKFLTTFVATIKSRNGRTIWKKSFQLLNPYSSIPVSMPLANYAQDTPVLHHALGVSLHELSKEIISDLGGTPHDASFPIWEISKQ